MCTYTQWDSESVSLCTKADVQVLCLPSSALDRGQWKCKIPGFWNIKSKKGSQLPQPHPINH